MLRPARCGTPLELEAMPVDNEWRLTAPLVWLLMNADLELMPETLIIPAGFVTDLASIPRVFQNILSVTGKSRRAAVAHDFLYCIQDRPRADADEFLRQALIAEGMGATEARIYWLGVRAGGWLPWGRRAKSRGSLPAGLLMPEDLA